MSVRSGAFIDFQRMHFTYTTITTPHTHPRTHKDSVYKIQSEAPGNRIWRLFVIPIHMETTQTSS